MTNPAMLALDGLAAVLIIAGLYLAFLQRGLSSWLSAKGAEPPLDERGAADHGPLAGRQQVASVLRMIGVMLMAFGVVICAFANLIAYYSARLPT